MAGEPTVTVVGNLTRDPRINHTEDGTPVAGFTVAVTPRRKDGDEWKDGEPTFYSCTCWRDHADNVAASLVKGTRVMVQGRLTTRKYQDKDGADRLSVDIDVDDVAPTLRFAEVKVTDPKLGKSDESTEDYGGDPWGTAPAAASAGDDEAPF